MYKLGVFNLILLYVWLGEMGVNNLIGFINFERGFVSGNRVWCKLIMVISFFWLIFNVDKVFCFRRLVILFGIIIYKFGWNILKWFLSVVYVYLVYVFLWFVKMIVSEFWFFVEEDR